jgi:hypothetical protein
MSSATWVGRFLMRQMRTDQSRRIAWRSSVTMRLRPLFLAAEDMYQFSWPRIGFLHGIASYCGEFEATVEFLKPFYFELGEAADCFEFEKEFIALTLW